MNLILRDGNVSFSPRARLIKLLGGELIRDEVMAIGELVKNAYDADARCVTLTFNGTSGDDGTIIIEDDGRGMDLAVLLNNWMQPAGSTKANRDRHHTPKGRRALGEKGVGRFAVDRLGRFAELISRAEGSDTEFVASFDWDEFEDDTRLLSDISVRWLERKAQVMDHPGTRITVKGLRARWKERTFRRLSTRLQRLLSPMEGNHDFRIELVSDEFPDYHGPLQSSFLKRATYCIQAEFDGDASIVCRLGDVQPVTHLWDGPGDLNCGPIRVTIHCFDLETEALAKVGPPQEVRAWLRERSGVNVYRDGFRVLPYGEPDDDWLRLDQRRINNPMTRLSNNQVCGYVEITRDANPELRDQTNRGGILQSQAFEDLRKLTLFVLQIVEMERQTIRHPETHEEEPFYRSNGHGDTDALLVELREIAARSRNGGLLNVMDRLRKSLDRERSGHDQEITGYLELAAIGQGAKFASHALKPRLKELQGLIRSLERKGVNQGDTGYLYMAHGALSELQDVAELIGNVAPNRRGSRRTVDVAAEIASFEAAVVYLLKSHEVSLTVEVKRDVVLRTEMPAALLHQIFHILLWNALDALKKTDNRKIRIRLHQTKQGQASILFEDNGSGIADVIRDQIFEPGFTTKPNGGGMGLAIARRLLADMDSTIELGTTGGKQSWTTFEIAVGLKRSRVTVD